MKMRIYVAVVTVLLVTGWGLLAGVWRSQAGEQSAADGPARLEARRSGNGGNGARLEARRSRDRRRIEEALREGRQAESGAKASPGSIAGRADDKGSGGSNGNQPVDLCEELQEIRRLEESGEEEAASVGDHYAEEWDAMLAMVQAQREAIEGAVLEQALSCK